MVEKDTIQIYHKALLNNGYFEKKTTFIKKLKILSYYFMIIFFNRYSKDNYRKIHVINGKMELKLAQNGEYENVYYGSFIQNNFKGIKVDNTVVSSCKRKKRLVVLLDSIKQFYSNRDIGGNLAYWIDFCFWDDFVSNCNAEVLLSNGHFDRLTTTLSYLCKKYEIKFYMKQHGLISESQHIPCKIYCNRLYAFDDNEILKFTSNIISNDDCDLHKEYVSKVRFDKTDKAEYTIGVIEQPLKESEDVIDTVLRSCRGHKVLVMLHPNSDIKRYRKFMESSNISFLQDKKEWNLDIIVSTPSTLAYDYLQSGFVEPILFIDINDMMPEYKNRYKNLHYIDNLKELGMKIGERVSEYESQL